jgi:acid phosphatase family membrane protein YuiD
MIDVIRDKPFLIAILAGIIAQALKVAAFIIIEKRVNYKRFVQPDGSPNLHAATMTALTLAVGVKDGFLSPVFSISLCLSILIFTNIMHLKHAASKQAEVVFVIMERLRKVPKVAYNGNAGLLYRPIDVFTGIVVGVLFTIIIT